MIWDLVGRVFGGLWGYVAAAGGALAIVIGAYLKGASAARNKLRAAQADDAIKRAAKGREAVSKARRGTEAGESPEDIVRQNDGRWQ